MKLNLINDDQLQIIVTKKDMFGKDMRRLFRDIIEQARHEFGFEVLHNTSLMVEAYPLSEESMILTITKINNEDVNFDIFMAEPSSEEPWAVFEFSTLDDVLELAKLVSAEDIGENSLYKFDGKFGLYVKDVNLVPETYRGFFVEYGEISSVTKEFLEEHGEIFVAESALFRLGTL